MKVGRAIREDGFAGSTLDHLDSLSASIPDFFENNSAGIHLPSAASFRSSFLALASPSLEGKTQSAFVLRKSRAAYFVIHPEQLDSTSSASAQKIYKCFKNQSEFLKSVVRNDMDIIRGKDARFDFSASSFLSESFKNTQLGVLGYFAALMEVASHCSAENWMESYLTAPHLKFRSLSINQFTAYMESLGPDFRLSIFLDEFKNESYAVFVRNLARALGIPCIVANTNSSITNLISSTSNMSRLDNVYINWCIAFKRLNPFIPSWLESISTELSYIKSCCNPEAAAIRTSLPSPSVLFDPLFKEFILNTRPGVAAYFIEALKKLHRELFGNTFNGPRTLARFLQYCITTVCEDLMSRKSFIVTSKHSMIATIGLHLEQAFNPIDPQVDFDQDEIEGDDEVEFGGAVDEYICFRHHRLIRDHLFYLNNPVQPEKCFFPIFRGRHESDYPIQIFRAGEVATSKSWSTHYTSFNENELFTLLACLNVPLSRSIRHIMNEKFFEHTSSPTAPSDAPNSKALKLPGNHLEISVAASIAEASKHAFVLKSNCYLNGLEGSTFLRNLLVNCVARPLDRLRQRFLFDQPCKLLETYFKRIRIPFIYSINREVDFFEQLTATPDFDIFMDSYERPSDNDQADGFFSFREFPTPLLNERIDASEPENFPLLRTGELKTVGVECKNLKNDLIVTKLKVAIENLRSHSARIGLVFCKDFKPPGGTSGLVRLCNRERINVHFVEHVGNSFTIKPYSERYLPFSQNEHGEYLEPSMDVIVFSFKRLDPIYIHRQPIREPENESRDDFEEETYLERPSSAPPV